MPSYARNFASAGFLDPKVLGRIGNLELLARTVVDGFINGLHRAPYLGMSIDFAEHRSYNPGDDIRRVDWKLYARTDRYYVKEFEADTNANFMAVLDVSRSMSYTGSGIPKLDYARFLAACLMYFSREQRDRVGLATFDADIVDYVPPSAKHLEVILHTLNRIEAAKGQRGELAPALVRVADRLRRRGIIALISDFYEEPDAIMEAVKPLRARGHDLMVFHLLDPTEIEFPFTDATNFRELETGERTPVVPENMRVRYRELVQEHIAALTQKFSQNRVDYAMFNTGMPLDYALFTFLSARERLNRVR
ncbi:MAG: DUF58 domain-containing protein [Gemmatimonadetes bacterium]|nr:DUF58 domain-containing protein [Gemmatimonadota bacterium]